MVTQNTLRTHKRKKGVFGKKIRFVTALDLIKFLERIKEQGWLLTCALISELPYNVSTMMQYVY